MGFFSRFQVFVQVTFSIGVVAVIVQNVAPVIDAEIDPTGSFTILSTQVQDLGPFVLAMFLLAIVVWFIVSTVREERSVEVRRGRRRRR
jgi:hypothetical protein